MKYKRFNKKFNVLRATMLARKITVTQLAKIAGCTTQSIRNKLAGRTDWQLEEMKKIQHGLESNETLDILFWR